MATLTFHYENITYSLDVTHTSDQDETNADLNTWKFIVKDLKTFKEYEQIYIYTELVDKYKIFSVYPHKFENIISRRTPEVVFEEKKAILIWNISIDEEKEDIVITVGEKHVGGKSDEIMELERCNKVLSSRVIKLEGEIISFNNRFNMFVDAQIKSIFEQPHLIKILADGGVDFRNHPIVNTYILDKLVQQLANGYFIFKDKENDYLRELVKYGYSLSHPTPCVYNESKILVERKYSLLYDLFCKYATLYNERDFNNFKDMLDCILKTSDLNILIDGVTILDYLTCVASQDYTGKIIHKMIPYLRKHGAKFSIELSPNHGDLLKCMCERYNKGNKGVRGNIGQDSVYIGQNSVCIGQNNNCSSYDSVHIMNSIVTNS
jgi:hypothetical protein